MKRFLIFALLLCSATIWAQQNPVNCNLAVAGCSTPTFGISTNNQGNTVDFTSGSVSNPSTNPQGINLGCLLTGETTSTFITINVVSNGTLEWSIIGSNANGCFDWIMWQDPAGSGVGGACTGINGNTLPPVACNWNSPCGGNTGMASGANTPAGGNPGNYQPPLTVTAGQSFVLCLSNFSSTTQSVNLDFFGSAQVVCGVSAPDQTICQGASATVNIATPGYTSPQFQWLVTNGVSNTSGGSGVIVNPTVTTTYKVRVTQPNSNPPLIDTATFTITVIPPPAPNAGPDATICLGNPFQLQGVISTPTSPGHTANWQVLLPVTTPPATAGFAPNANSMTATTTPTQPGIYKYVLRQGNTACGIRRDTMILTVSQMVLTTTPTNPLCPGAADGTITVVAQGAVEYSFNGGTTWVTNPTATGLVAATYNVCARNALGCQKCMNVILTDPPVITIAGSNDTTVCQNGTASLVAMATGGTTFTYTWDPAGADNGAAQSYNPLATTTYSVFATNQNGCNSPVEQIVVTVREPISATITETQFVCPGYEDTLNAVATGGIGVPYTYTWSTGEIDNGVSGQLIASPQDDTQFTVTVTDACESTPFVISSNINVNPVPLVGIDAVDPTLCEPAEFIVFNMNEDQLTASSYWRLSDGQTATGVDTLKPTPLADGSYSVTLVVTSPDGCIDSTTFDNYLTSFPLPVPDFRWAPDPVKMFNTEVRFSNKSTGAVSYQWIFEEGSPATSSTEDPIIMFPDGVASTYEVMLVATTEEGCRDTIYKDLRVMPEVLVFAPNAFTPDGDEFNQSWRVYLEGIDPYDFTLLVYNRWGQVVFESHDIEASWDGTYHGQIMPAGTYKWTIRTKDQLNDAKYEWIGDINIIR